MREALEEARKFIATNKYGYFESRLLPKIDAALAAPARNVDKLETKEAALAALKERFPVEENFAGFEMAVEWLLDTQDFCLAWPVSHRFGTTAQKGGAE